MRTLVVYDSLYGNTEAIAHAVAAGLRAALGPGNPVEVVTTDTAAEMLDAVALLVVGGPTHGSRPSPPMQGFLDSLDEAALAGVEVAAFDTRTDMARTSGPMRLLGKVFDRMGYAAPRILDALEAKGARPVAPAEGFVVEAKEGPLRDGEPERATAWATRVGADARTSSSA